MDTTKLTQNETALKIVFSFQSEDMTSVCFYKSNKDSETHFKFNRSEFSTIPIDYIVNAIHELLELLKYEITVQIGETHLERSFSTNDKKRAIQMKLEEMRQEMN